MNPDTLVTPIGDPWNPIQGIAGAFKAADLTFQLPMLALVLVGLVVVLLDAFSREGGSRRWLMGMSVFACALAMVMATVVWRGLETGPRTIMGGMLIADRFSMLLSVLVAATAALTLLLSTDYLREHHVEYGEYYALVLFSAAGMMMMVMAADLVAVFLGIETMSLGVYVLTGSFRKNRRSAEAAMKYFLTGAFASGFLLYGIALVYGVAGTTAYAGIAQVASKHDTNIIFLIGMFMLIVAFGFKVAAVPFHMWAPDAYEGAPTPITGFMSAGVKAAGVAAMLRLFTSVFGGDILPEGRMGWASLVGLAAAATMTLGNVVALRQENVKRLLAYSSISHAGYLLIGVVAAGLGAGTPVVDMAGSATLFYLVAYSFTSIGAFGVIAWLGRRGDERLHVDDWSGLAARHPAAAFAMTVFLLSLAGMPPLGGFLGKFYVFKAAMAVDGGRLNWLVILAALNSVVSVFYYLKIVMAMYFREPTREPRPRRSPTMSAALVLAALVVIEMGVLPNWWMGVASKSILGAAVGGAP
jgi:NADH-quinone oxidoreductase subunit N